MKYTHPEDLLATMDRQIWPNLPSGLHRPDGRLTDPNFFPGGSGYLKTSDWLDVRSRKTDSMSTNEETGRKFLVIGHFQANLGAYGDEQRTPGSRFRRTWTRLASLLDGTDPSEFFLANARLGLPEGVSSTGFRSSPEHDQRCADVLADLVEIVQPQAILCLGPHAARILAMSHSDLKPWKAWTSFSALNERSERELELELRDRRVTAAVVRHPSSIPSAADWGADKRIVDRLFRSTSDETVHG